MAISPRMTGGGGVSPTQIRLHWPESGQGRRALCGEHFPLGQGGRALGFVCLSADEVAVLVEVVVESGVDGAELLQRLHLPEPHHGPFSSSEGQV